MGGGGRGEGWGYGVSTRGVVIEERRRASCGNSQFSIIKKEVEFLGVFKKNSCGISMGLCFLTLEFPMAEGLACPAFKCLNIAKGQRPYSNGHA